MNPVVQLSIAVDVLGIAAIAGAAFGWWVGRP